MTTEGFTAEVHERQKSWKWHKDLSDKRTARRQSQAALLLAAADLQVLLRAAADGFKLPPWICQIQARAARVAFEKSAYGYLRTLRDRGARLVSVTVVDHRVSSHEQPFGSSPRSIATALADQLSACSKVLCAVGILDTDFTVGRGPARWDPHHHVIVAVDAKTSIEARRLARDAIADIPSSLQVPRPVLVKEVRKLSGALRYCGKALCWGAISRRTCFQSQLEPQGRWKAKKRSLQRAQEIQLVHQLRGVPSRDRLLLVGFERQFELKVSSEFYDRASGFLTRTNGRRAHKHDRS